MTAPSKFRNGKKKKVKKKNNNNNEINLNLITSEFTNSLFFFSFKTTTTRKQKKTKPKRSTLVSSYKSQKTFNLAGQTVLPAVYSYDAAHVLEHHILFII